MDLSTQRLMMGAAGSAAPTYVEDVFSTWLYTGTSSTQTITNGIDLSGKGGLVWIKERISSSAQVLYDTNRGTNKYIMSQATNSEGTSINGLNTFLSTGFQLGEDSFNLGVNRLSETYASWTFRKAKNFFDVVTYTGTGSVRTVAHNLGSVPGCIIIKRLDVSANWAVYHRSVGAAEYLTLNSTLSSQPGANFWNSTAPTSTEFTVGSENNVNILNGSFVAYLFAHDAGGFGDSGNDNVVSCGSYTGTGSAGNFVNLGWEPQWLLIKRTNGAAGWIIHDSMRGITTGGDDPALFPNLSDAEFAANVISVNATGFTLEATGSGWNGVGDSYAYIAIRRGPMKTPTDATQVYIPLSVTISSNPQTFTTNFPVDHVWTRSQNLFTDSNPGFASRLTNTRLVPDSTAAESTTSFIQFDFNDRVRSSYYNPGFGTIQCMSAFRRAPGFFDVVAYTGTGVARTINHNLGVVPELGIFKIRSTTGFWLVYNQALGNNDSLVLQSDSPASGPTSRWDNTSPTNQVFTLGAGGPNASGQTYIGYLFASCPGVSKVGSYTGTGTTLQVNCGFTSGARFILIKRTDSTGDWYVWDSARGIVAGNDPYLLLNSTANQVTNTDFVDTFSSGFEISSTAPAAINANGGNFIFLAIA